MTDPTERNTPPETQSEWLYIWQGARKAHDLNIVFGPVAQVAKSWKWWLAAAALAAWLNRPGIMQALATIAGGGQ